MATVKLPVGLPDPGVMLQEVTCCALDPPTVHVLSLAKNPEPVTVTMIPILPEVGLIVIVGPVKTVNVVVAKSPVFPFTCIVYVPA